jgi:alpha/beta hydrolase fold
MDTDVYPRRPDYVETWDFEADVVIARYGIAGAAAAVEAAMARADVLVIERTGGWGGAAAMAGGFIYLGAGTPQLIEALDAGFPQVHTVTGADARAVIRSRFVAPVDPEVVGEVRDAAVHGLTGDIAIRMYRPACRSDSVPTLVYAHGGGFVFCDLDSHDGLCRNLTNLLPAVAVSVGYRLAPEHRWPAAAEDVLAVGGPQCGCPRRRCPPYRHRRR